MPNPKLLELVPLLGGLCCAAWIDSRERRIPNWLTVAIAVAGFAQSLISAHSLVTPWQAVLGFCAGFGLGVALFVLRAVGGGDVKLLAGIGAWLGAGGMMKVYAAAAIVGLVMVLVQCAYHRRLGKLFRNSTLLSLNLANVGAMGVEAVAESGTSCRSVDRPLPYAVPVLIGFVLLVLLKMI